MCLAILRGQVARQGAMLAYDYIFAWMALFVLFMVPLVLILKRPQNAAPPSATEALSE